MARKKTSPTDELIDTLSRFPWWVGVMVAVVGYFAFRFLAIPGPTPKAADLNGLMMRAVVQGLATGLQYIVPVIGIAGAALSLSRRRQRQDLVTNVSQSKAADALDGMSWQEFEVLVGEAFRLQGFRVAETGGGGADGGVDLVLTREGEKFLVQCKQWKAYKVGVEVVRELFGVMAARGAAGGFVVTSGTFTIDARTFADGRNVKLVDGEKLFRLVRQARDSLPSTRGAVPSEPAAVQPPAVPTCPVCGSGMVRRTAKKGANAGSAFWGCSTYPVCKGTRPAE